jgi:hypothetical protein
MKKRSLFLFEMLIATVLIGMLLTGLFHMFYQGFHGQIKVRHVKEEHLRLELFEHRVKHLFTHARKLCSGSHPQAMGEALLMECLFPKPNQPRESCLLTAMLFVNYSKQLCLALWPEGGDMRSEVLLTSVTKAPMRFFSDKKWHSSWSSKQDKHPRMVALDIIWEGKEMPFVFFCGDPAEIIDYFGVGS